ncbi:MAG TPA: hypothetical protein VEF71_14690 [Streptosporangiaceae bacterium]|nr:hypothetical protein [Streptosporangiaceae bacterium]
MTALANMRSIGKTGHVLAAGTNSGSGYRQPAGGCGWFGAVLGAVEVSRIALPGG